VKIDGEKTKGTDKAMKRFVSGLQTNFELRK
jgi:hypothetical protein